MGEFLFLGVVKLGCRTRYRYPGSGVPSALAAIRLRIDSRCARPHPTISDRARCMVGAQTISLR